MQTVEQTVSRATPGPWDAYVTDDGFKVYQTDGRGNGDHIMCVKGEPVSEANARLIAAAPDLLEVARYILACYDQEVAQIQRPGEQKDITRLAGTIAGCHVNVGINVDAFADRIRDAVSKAEGTKRPECGVRDCGVERAFGLQVCENHARGMAAAFDQAR